MSHAQAIVGLIYILSTETLPDNVSVATVRCGNYNEFDKLPSAINYDSKSYALTGWNSDRNIAYYRTDAFRCLATILDK